jgi:hypothetical protein
MATWGWSTTRRALLLAGLAALGACATAAPDAADESARAEATLSMLHEAAAKADGARYFSLFTPDAVFVGTDVSEYWTLAQFRAYAAPVFGAGRGWTYRARERQIAIEPIPCRCVASFHEVLDSEKYGTARGSGVLRKVGGEWKVAQYVLSFPVPNALAERVTAEIKVHEAASPQKGP